MISRKVIVVFSGIKSIVVYSISKALVKDGSKLHKIIFHLFFEVPPLPFFITHSKIGINRDTMGGTKFLE